MNSYEIHPLEDQLQKSFLDEGSLLQRVLGTKVGKKREKKVLIKIVDHNSSSKLEK